MALNDYQYTAITAKRTIRLMHLYPGNGSEPVCLSLVTATLDAAPDFESISYCWADAPDQQRVTCNGSALSITGSLFTGLVHFRRSDRRRILWADAICINQADPVEKTAQVLLMPSIYSQARRVLVWLGIADHHVYGTVPPDVRDSIHRAAGFLPEFDPENAEEMAAKAQALRHESEQLRKDGKPNILDHDWAPLAALMARPWFGRKWVVQEVALAREVLLTVGGGVEIPWSEVAELAFSMEGMGVPDLALLELGKKYNEEDEEARRLGSRQASSMSSDEETERGRRRHQLNSLLRPLHCVIAILMIQIYRHNGTLIDGVVATKLFRCTDPRDHVYSLLSLGAVGPTVTPDYEASDTDAFHRFSMAMLLEGQSLKLLSLAPDKMLYSVPGMERLPGLPSWVPDLRLMRVDVLASYTVRPQAFFAGGRGKPVISISKDGLVLSCQGRVIDATKMFARSMIDMMLDDFPEYRTSWELLLDPLPERRKKRLARWLVGCYQLVFGRGSRYGDVATPVPSDESMMAFSRTMVCGIDIMRNRISPELMVTFAKFIQWAADRAEDKADEKVQYSAAVPNYATAVEGSIAVFATALKFCVTENGRFGRVPYASQPGDRICVLVGGEVPFIIRPTGRGMYTLVGECYVDGIMDGEALEPGNEAAKSFETIHLE